MIMGVEVQTSGTCQRCWQASGSRQRQSAYAPSELRETPFAPKCWTTHSLFWNEERPASPPPLLRSFGMALALARTCPAAALAQAGGGDGGILSECVFNPLKRLKMRDRARQAVTDPV